MNRKVQYSGIFFVAGKIGIGVIFLHLVSLSELSAAGVNIALHKPCKQISNYESNAYQAAFAVDGNLHRNVDYCSHTKKKPNGRPTWLFVDLQSLYRVHEVAILNRNDEDSVRLRNFLVTLWNVDPGPLIQDDMDETYCTCLHYPGVLPSTGLINLPCSTNCTGRFLAVISPFDYLTLCEVEVYGQLVYHLNQCHAKGVSIRSIVGWKVNVTNEQIHSRKSKEECVALCVLMNDCWGLNYKDMQDECQMIRNYVNPLTDLVEDSTYQWLMMTEINYCD